mgnify:CR=1 FL=1
MEGKTKANAAKEKENKDRSSKMVIVKNLIEKGKKNGTLTYKEIMDERDKITSINLFDNNKWYPHILYFLISFIYGHR